MKLVTIDPKQRKVERVSVKDPREAYAMVGLKPGKVDHGVLMRLHDGSAIGYVVYEFSFFVSPAEQFYFALNGHLMAGPVVLYQFDEAGRTIDMGEAVIETRWFDDAAQVEYLIGLGVLVRPQLAINGEVIWSWPQPAPPDLAQRVAERDR